MKRLLKSDVFAAEENSNKNEFNFADIADILNQIEELQKYNVAIRKEDGELQLNVGESVYKIELQADRYPRRRLTKIATLT